MADNVYPIPTIEDQPFPSGQESSPITGAGQGTTVGNDTNYAVPSTVSVRFPIKYPAPEVNSLSLDTQGKKILGQYSFTESGAIQVGTYSFGVSGDLRISPDGITARNVNGVTTFSIDGTNGSATFLGTLRAGTVIAGDGNVVTEGDALGGRLVIYIAGLPAIILGVV